MGKLGKDGANKYMREIWQACGTKLVTDSLYGDRDGHLRLAREIGAALPDFNDEGQKAILMGSYSVIYVRACFLRPKLDAKEWIGAMRIGRQRAMEIYKAY